MEWWFLQPPPFVVLDPERIIPYTNSTYFNPRGSIPYIGNLSSVGTFKMGDKIPCISKNTFSHISNSEYGKSCILSFQVPHEIYEQTKGVYHTSTIDLSSIEYHNVSLFSTRNYWDSNFEKDSMDDLKSWLLQLFKNEHSRKGKPILLFAQELARSL